MTPEDLLAAANKRAEVFVDKKSPLRLYLRSAENVFKQVLAHESSRCDNLRLVYMKLRETWSLHMSCS